MSYTGWHFRRTASGEFVTIARNLHADFWRGTVAIPPDPGSAEILIVDVIVEIRNRVAQRVQSIRFYRFPVDARGIRDRAHRKHETAAYAALVNVRGKHGPSRASDRMTERTILGEYQWEPTAPDLAAIIVAINRRARRFIAGHSPVRLA